MERHQGAIPKHARDLMVVFFLLRILVTPNKPLDFSFSEGNKFVLVVCPLTAVKCHCESCHSLFSLFLVIILSRLRLSSTVWDFTFCLSLVRLVLAVTSPCNWWVLLPSFFFISKYMYTYIYKVYIYTLFLEHLYVYRKIEW
jgi:hypothetical protein